MYCVPIVRNTYPFFSPCYDPVTMFYATAAAVTVQTTQTAMAGHQERKRYKEMLHQRDVDIGNAEKKAALATSQAAKAAQTKLKKFRLSQTRSILTSPLGVQDEAVTGRTSLLGG